MENIFVANNVTLASLRGLLREGRKNVSRKEAVYVELKLWNYSENELDGRAGRINESIGVYRSGTGEGTHDFVGVAEARKFINSWKTKTIEKGEN